MADFKEPVDSSDFSIFDTTPEALAAELGGKTSFEADAQEETVEDATTRETSAVEAELTDGEVEKTVPEQTTEEKPAADAAAQPKTYTLGDDDLVTIKQDGKDVPVKWGEYKGGVMRQADYTRKMQKVSERTTEIEGVATLLQQREERFLSIASDPEKLAKLYAKLTGQDIAAAVKQPEAKPTPDADELVTHGDIQRTKEEVLADLKREAAEAAKAELEAVNAKQQELAQREFVSTLVSTTEETLDAVLKDHADTLGDIPYVDAIIKKMAWTDFQPKTTDEVKQALIASAKKLSEQFAARGREQKKVEVVKKAALDKGIESGGTPPGRTPKTYLKKNDMGRDDVDWDDLDRDVVSFITSRAR